MSAAMKFQKFDDHANLKELEPEVYTEIVSIGANLHLLDALPPVLMHYDLVAQNVFVNEAGDITGVMDWDGAGLEAFGMVIFALYEAFFGSVEGGHWSAYGFPAGNKHPGQTICQVLETAFWDTLWEYVAPGITREESEEAVWVALGVGIVNWYFVVGMLDEIDLGKGNHDRSLDYAKGILLHIRDSRNQSATK